MKPIRAFFIFRVVLALYGVILEIMLPFIDCLPLAISELKASLEFQAETISFWSSAISLALFCAVGWMIFWMFIFFATSHVLGLPKREPGKSEKPNLDIGHLFLFGTIAKDAILYHSQDAPFFIDGVLMRLLYVANDSTNITIIPTVIFAFVTVYSLWRQGRIIANNEERQLPPTEIVEDDLKEQQPEVVEKGGTIADAVV